MHTIRIFKKGDLIKFNEHGEELFRYLNASVGIISSDPIVMYEYEFDATVEFIVYDLLVDGQLFKHIPEEFIDRIILIDEEDTEELE
jgi:hypothetical protein|tara:strand:+ start:604 stop:864 length:261 start_codon:yes stop_codon:yes gene_type:complete